MIPMARPDLSGNEADYAEQAVRSGWVSSLGPFVTRFETEFAALCDGRRAVSTSTGTAALHLALAALGVAAGDEVIIPSLTYVATANAVAYQGATPVFADVSADTWTLDPDSVASVITPLTRAIIAVHLYGHPCDMDRINEIAAQRGIWVIEDAAEAHGARYKGQPVGALGSAGAFSFYGNKIITCGEGGAIVTNDEELAERAEFLRGHALVADRGYYHPEIGFNYRLSNVSCAILCGQLERFDEMQSERSHIYRMYRDALSDIEGLAFQEPASWAEPAPWLFPLLVDEASYGLSRDMTMERLRSESIETRPFFLPLHTLPPYSEPATAHTSMGTTSNLSSRGLNLPTYVGLTESDVGRVADALRRIHVESIAG